MPLAGSYTLTSLVDRLEVLGYEARARTAGYCAPDWYEVLVSACGDGWGVGPPAARPARASQTPGPRTPDYCQPAPHGLGSVGVASRPGGRGEYAALVDFEQGWAFDHPDLAHRDIQLIGTTDSHRSHSHGTAVLGIIAAHGPGLWGMAPRLGRLRVAGEYRHSGEHDKVIGLVEALEVMEPGEILLVESQGQVGGLIDLPLEAEPPFDDILALATALQIVVIAAAGNGGHDLDEISIAGRRLSRRSEYGNSGKDSGCWLVGACGNGAADFPICTLGPGCCTCFGSRIDFFAAGDFVETLGVDYFGAPIYRDCFHATSAAAAIVAGAAAIAQSLVIGKYGSPMGPRELRDGLRAHATPLSLCGKDGGVGLGYMPDLERFAASL